MTTPVIRIRNGHGEFLATVEAVDQGIAEFLPASPDELRAVMLRLVPDGDYSDVHSVTEFLVMIMATAGRGRKQRGMQTEKVSENYQPAPGVMDTRTYWIAYPDHVAVYGRQEDRISRAAGTGATEAEALENAECQN
jgi:hypothetical protein